MGTLSPTSIPPEIIGVCRRLREGGHRAYLVGGAVRDHLRMPPGAAAAKDFDIATSARPEQVIDLFGRRHTVPTGIQHGTVTVLVPRPGGHVKGHREHVEVTTFRGEGAYSDGRRPDQVAFIDDLTEDLRRRDFTINAIAYDPIDDRLEDPSGGQEDLGRRRLRAVGVAAARFAEDGLRTMRAVRFAAQLGFALDPATSAAIPGALPTFRKVSAERVRDELLKTLAAAEAPRGLALMRDTGLLAEVLPELAELLRGQDPAFTDLLGALARLPADALLRLACLLWPLREAGRDAEAPIARLKLSARESARVLQLLGAALPAYEAGWSDGQIRRYLAATSAQLRDDLRRVLAARGEAALEQLFQRAEAVLAQAPALSIGALQLSGKDVMERLAMAPSPRVGELLRRLFERVLDDPALNQRERLLALLDEEAGR